MIKKIIVALIMLSALVSCRSFKEAEFTGVKGFKVNTINLQGIDADVILGIKNPNPIGFSIYPSEFDIKLMGVGIGKAKLKKRVHISANTEKEYTFRLKSAFKDMNMMDILKLVNAGNFGTIQVKGNLKAGKFYLKKNFPVDVKESLR
jgi:LEA14-like dessication related protein